MALTLVENKICSACGADIRPNSLFCYSCGSAVSDEKKPEENFTAEKSITVLSEVNEKKAINEMIAADEPENKIINEPEKPIVAEEIKLKSAANMRRKSKSFQNKKVEIVWEEHENAPNVWFISVAIVLAIAAAIVLFLAVYLK